VQLLLIVALLFALGVAVFAVQNAEPASRTSIAGMLLTTETLVAEAPEKEEESGGPA